MSMGSPLMIWYFSRLEKTLLCCGWNEFVFGGKKVLCLEVAVEKWSPAKR